MLREVPRPPARGRHVGRTRRHRVRRVVLTAVASLTVITLVAGAALYLTLQGNITSIDLTEALGTDRPDAVAGEDPTTGQMPLNILLLGSDTRTGLLNPDEFVGDASSPAAAENHSDTNLLVHLAADRRSAYVISIPRDSMVQRPDCDDPAAPVDPNRLGMFNGAFDEGGAACTVRTLETNTGVRIDHFALVNFEGFREMVDALGGVDMCIPEAVNDPATRLELDAGQQHLDGDTATKYVRARKSLGDGGDLGRIERQQAFLSAMVREVTSTGLLLRPDRLVSFLDAATNSLTTDPDLASLSALTGLARSLQKLPPEQIRFVTVPVAPYQPDPNRLIWTDEADELWDAARQDLPLPGTEDETPASAPSGEPSAGPEPTRDLVVAPDEIRVEVVNASGVTGLSRQAARALGVQGFVVTGATNGRSGTVAGVEVHYPADGLEAAATLASAFPGARLRPNDNLASGSFLAVLGADAPAVVEVPNRIGSLPLPDQPISAARVPDDTATSIVPRVAADDSCS